MLNNLQRIWLVNLDTNSDSNRPIEVQRFYYFRPGDATIYFFLNLDHRSWEEAMKMSLRELADFKGEGILKVEKGTKPADFLRTSYANDLIVSDRVIEILYRYQVRSFSTYKVKIFHGDMELKGYYGLAITGRGGPNDKNNIEHYIGSLHKNRMTRIKGIRPTAWDGSDLFTCDDLWRVALATERVKAIFEKEKVTNCQFRPAENFQA